MLKIAYMSVECKPAPTANLITLLSNGPRRQESLFEIERWRDNSDAITRLGALRQLYTLRTL